MVYACDMVGTVFQLGCPQHEDSVLWLTRPKAKPCPVLTGSCPSPLSFCLSLPLPLSLSQPLEALHTYQSGSCLWRLSQPTFRIYPTWSGSHVVCLPSFRDNFCLASCSVSVPLFPNIMRCSLALFPWQLTYAHRISGQLSYHYLCAHVFSTTHEHLEAGGRVAQE